ncbi:RNA polymerase sigma-70 factor [Chitinophaga sp. Cy-1792]|uniref:RNA polymerase sigma-70 factor n=1 Tax=Chitinophaga sp. Cy-1792 TaxID=2608339 RepID=UPI00141FD68D|nr:RNA polymerase sigma-70 factor [Chitinophaga sp. Cy-1792]NIG57610.1 RNA polymerase sigma-70 factor [Chitinophaga sp. Cy-1792]
MKESIANATDSELFQLIKVGNLQAFEQVYDRYFIRLLNFSYKRMGNREDALEVVQDVFVRLYTHRERITHTTYLHAYLQTLLKNGIIDSYRRKLVQEKQYMAIRELMEGQGITNTSITIDSKKLEEQIHQLVNQLPEKCKEAFLLSRVQYLSHQAIAAKMKISVSTVEKHIVKALHTLKKELGIVGLVIYWGIDVLR